MLRYKHEGESTYTQSRLFHVGVGRGYLFPQATILQRTKMVLCSPILCEKYMCIKHRATKGALLTAFLYMEN